MEIFPVSDDLMSTSLIFTSLPSCSISIFQLTYTFTTMEVFYVDYADLGHESVSLALTVVTPCSSEPPFEVL